MIVVEERPEVDVASRRAARAELRVEPADISFEDVPEGKVRIRVTVHNDGERRSLPTVMRLQSAPLGAFVPWQPLTVLRVPPIEAGDSREVSVDVERPHPATLGSFDRVPPSKLLTAVGSADESSPPNQGNDLLRNWKNLLSRQGADRVRRMGPVAFLAPDLMDLVGRGQTHWAGNINVFVNATPVERHRAMALRVYPGRANLAMFVVGGYGRGRNDAYSFEIAGVASDWQATLFDVTSAKTLVVGYSDKPIPDRQWVESSGRLMVMLLVQPPADCGEGNIEVRVTRRSCQKTAVVEFNLDPTALGTGCYHL